MPTVESVLTECCTNSGVTFKSVRKSHGDCNQVVYGSGGPGGICCALSLLWLSRYFKGQMDNDQFGGSHFGDLVMALNEQPSLKQVVSKFFGNLLSNTPAAPPTLGTKVSTHMKAIQDQEVDRVASFSVGKKILEDTTRAADVRVDLWEDITDKKGFKALFKNAMAALSVKHPVKFIDSPNAANFYSLSDGTRPYDSAIDFMTAASGASLIKFPTHYLAVISDKTRPKYKFLDVNGGQAITKDEAKFKAFLKEYFNGAVIDAYTKPHTTMQVTMASL